MQKRGFLFDMAVFWTGLIANTFGAYLKRWRLQARLSMRTVLPPKDEDENPIFCPALAKFEGRIFILLIMHWMFWALMLSFGMQNLFPWLQKFSEPMKVFGDFLGLVTILLFIALAGIPTWYVGKALFPPKVKPEENSWKLQPKTELAADILLLFSVIVLMAAPFSSNALFADTQPLSNELSITSFFFNAHHRTPLRNCIFDYLSSAAASFVS